MLFTFFPNPRKSNTVESNSPLGVVQNMQTVRSISEILLASYHLENSSADNPLMKEKDSNLCTFSLFKIGFYDVAFICYFYLRTRISLRISRIELLSVTT